MRKLSLAVLLLAPALALASGYAIPNPHPRDLGLCASGVAAQNDAGAAFALPASLSRLDGWSAQISGGGVNIASTWTDPAGRVGDVDMSKFTPYPIGAVAFGGKAAALGDRGWGVGLSFQPFGGAEVKWPDDWEGRYRIVKVDRRVFSGTLTGGIDALPGWVRLGGGLVYYYTTEKLTQKLWMQAFGFPPGPSQPDGNASIDASGGMFSYDLSGEFTPLQNVPLRIAIDYKHKATQTLKGPAEFNGIQPGVALVPSLAAVYTNQDARQKLTIPNTLNIGVAYRIIQPLLATFTYTFDRWVVYNEDRFVGDTNGAQIVLPRNYGNGHTFRGGVEYDLLKKLQVRGALQRDISGLTTDTYSPTLPDASTWGASLGATYKLPNGFGVEGGVFYAWFDRVTSTNNGLEPGFYPGIVPTPGGVLPAPGVFPPGSTFRGKYDTNALIFTVGVNWTPGAKG